MSAEFTLLETTIKLITEVEDGHAVGDPILRIEVEDYANIDPDADFLITLYRKAAAELLVTNPQVQRSLVVVPPPTLSLVEAAETLPENQ